MSSGSIPRVRGVALSLHHRPTQPITGFGPGGNLNEENTQDGIIYQNSIGDPNAAGGAIPADSTSPSRPIRSRQRPSTLYSAGKFSATVERPHGLQLDAQQLSSSRRSTAPAPPTTRWGTSWPAPCPWPPCGARRARARRTWTSRPRLVPSARTPTGAPMASTATPCRRPTSGTTNLPAGNDPSDSAATIPGVRYVYNVADTLLPELQRGQEHHGLRQPAQRHQ